VSVKGRMDDMLESIKESGREGVEIKNLLKTFYDKWGFRLSTIKSYLHDLEELEKVTIIGSRVYHNSIEPPKGLFRSTR
jgi:hypothetical protein